jgi:MFS family permease
VEGPAPRSPEVASTPDARAAAPAPTAAGRPVTLLLFSVAFLDVVGFSIIFPLFPQLLAHYLAAEGDASTIGALTRALQALTGEHAQASFLVTVLFGGVLGSLYSLLQFSFAPVWGALSDRFGRRPTLLVSLVGTLASFVGWAFAGNFVLLVFWRLLGGLMAGNLSTISAIAADTSTAETRSRAMGVVGAAIGIGFIVGPVVGGLTSLAALAPVGVAPAAALALTPFSAPAFAAAALAAANLALAAAKLPETLPRERRGRGDATRTASLVTMFTGIHSAAGRRANVVSFLFLTAFATMEFTLTFVTAERFGFAPRDNAGMFVLIGIVYALVQGGVVRRLGPRVGDRRLAHAGLVVMLPGFLLLALATHVVGFAVGLAIATAGSALANPTMSSLVSRYAPPEQQGLALGIFRSLGALSRVIGPLAGAALYWRFGASSPSLVAAALGVVPLVLALGLPDPATLTPVDYGAPRGRALGGSSP